MATELRYITDGLLCKFYGFTLTEARALDAIERDVYLRYMEMYQRLSEKGSRKKVSGYGG